MNFLVRYFSLKLARSRSSLVSPTPPPRLAFSSSRPTLTYHASLAKPMYRPMLSSSLLRSEAGEVPIVLGKSHAAAPLGLFFFAAHIDIPRELGEADVPADVVVLALAELHAADGGEILRVIGSPARART